MSDGEVAYLPCLQAQEAAYWEARRRGMNLDDKQIGDLLRVAAPILRKQWEAERGTVDEDEVDEEEPSEFVKKVRALPYRERLIFAEITFRDMTVEDLADRFEITPRQVEETYKETCIRVGLE